MKKMQTAILCATAALSCGALANPAHAVVVYDTLGSSNAFTSYGVGVGLVIGNDWESALQFSPTQTIKLTNVDLPLTQYLSAAPGSAVVTLRLDAGNVPGVAVESYTTGNVTTLSSLESLTSSVGATLAAGQKYWITVDHAANSLFGGMWNYSTQTPTGTVASHKNGLDWTVTTQPRPYALRITGSSFLPGDANQDGQITFDDYALFDRGQAKHLAGWNSGDFNGDAVVNNQDHLILDAAYLAQHPTGESEFIAARQVQYGDDYAAQLLTLVPEPATLGLIATSALTLLARRRRPA